jgi:Tol biopolymer transport system component
VNPPVNNPNCPLTCTQTSNPVTFQITSAAAHSASAAIAEASPAISKDGRFVAFAAAVDGRTQVFVRDTCQGVATGCKPRTILVSAAVDGASADADSGEPSMSSDGRYVAFSSVAKNLLPNIPQARQIYLRDTCLGADANCKPATQWISADVDGRLTGTQNSLPSVSSSGRFVAFLAVTPSADKSAKKSNTETNSGLRQVFVRDTCIGAKDCTPSTTRISMQPGDGLDKSTRPARPAVSADGSRTAIPAGNMAMLFTRSVAVDDRIFVAATSAENE